MADKTSEEKVAQFPIVLNDDKSPAAGTLSTKDIKEVDEYARVNGWARRQAAAELIKLGLKNKEG